MSADAELLRQWDAILRAEGLGRVEDHRNTERGHVRRRWRGDKCAYWDEALEFEAHMRWCRVQCVTARDARAWHMHIAGMPRWMIAMAIGSDPTGRDARDAIERTRRAIHRWRRRAAAARLGMMRRDARDALAGSDMDLAMAFCEDVVRYGLGVTRGDK